MSADNGIYVLQTPKGSGLEYRVAHQMAIDNYRWDDEKGEYANDPKIQIQNARKMWKGCKVFTDINEALKEAKKLYDEVGWTEYGISFVEIDAEF